LRRHSRIALDTSIFIYYLEDFPRYLNLAKEVFDWIGGPGHSTITSTVTMAELLVKPYRDEPVHADAIYGTFASHPRIEWIAPDLLIAQTAAEIRAAHRLKIPDALQAATAVHAGASGLIANDAVFRRVPAFETLPFEELL
jgi:predicted nucleic acid-binding protein